MNRFFKRIDKIDDINILSRKVCKLYNLGNLIDTKVIEIGYEDFNAIIDTETGKYLMKVFSNSRDDEEAKDCVNRADIAGINNVATPKVYENLNGEKFSIVHIGKLRFKLALIQYINGLDFLNLKEKPSMLELEKIVDIAARLSKIKYTPPFIYDSWAISSFCQEFEKKREYISNEYLLMIEPVYKKFKEFNYDALPKAFVHGDMVTTNMMRDNNGKVWLIDFSVSNYTARLKEIAVICDDIALVVGNKEESEKRIKHVFELWCQTVDATDFEKESFPLLLTVANSINIMNSLYEKYNGNIADETETYLNAGIFGLSLFK